MKDKTMNFTCVEVLPSLLDKTKTQSIRKAWKENSQYVGDDLVDNFKDSGSILKYKTLSKPAKYKVGDKVQLVWDVDSGVDWFKKIDGTPALKCKEECKIFNKNPGTVEITEVFEIKIIKGKQPYSINTSYDWDGQFGKHKPVEGTYHPFIKDLAKQDGFKSAKEMFKWFDKNYDLSTPKEFWVYRWKWLE